MAAGAKVVVSSRKADACAEAEAHLRGTRRRPALGVPTHMGDLDASRRSSTATVDAFGGSTSSSTTRPTPLDACRSASSPRTAWDKSFDVNLRGPVFLVEARAPPPRAERGNASVVNVISAGAFLVLGERRDVRRGQGRR